MAGLAVAIGIVESAMARYRLVRVPQFIVGAATLSVVAFIVLLV
jgi:formate hydrogenlyase subunit 4